MCPCNLVYSGSKENVRLTMVARRVLYENGAFFVGEPVQDIYRAVDAALCRDARSALIDFPAGCGAAKAA